jgi:ArsR family transcriptional regulator
MMKSSMKNIEVPYTTYLPCSLCRILPEAKPMSVNVISEDLITQDDDIERASRSLKAMSHPLRLKILCTLGDQEISVQDIVEHVGTSQSNISQHLAILRDKGILASRKDANRVFYRVGDSRTLRLIGMMRDVFCSR